jgi:hypothetical protein
VITTPSAQLPSFTPLYFFKSIPLGYLSPLYNKISWERKSLQRFVSPYLPSVVPNQGVESSPFE